MGLPPDALGWAAVVAAIVSVVVHCYVAGKAGTGFAVYGLLTVTAIAAAAIALLASPACPPAGAVADFGVLLAGGAAFMASAWLRFACDAARGPDAR